MAEGLGRRARRVKRFPHRHGDLAVFLAVVIVFVIRIAAARDRYLSPDEALHVEAASSPTLMDTYANSRFLAHPPLFFLVLHVWLRAGRSETFLRLLPMIFGVGFLWFAHRWTSRLFGRTAGLTTLLVLAFSPAFLPLSG
ncbi:MAG TPA: glycosyltransferase family 39 protein, partial [Thermoanaerobaculia bacterium]